MTDYAPMTMADPSWTWWMTTAAAAAMRLRNIRDRHGGDGESDDDEFSDCKKRKLGAAAREGCSWNAYDDDDDDVEDHGAGWLSTAEPGPLDLSVKATLTAATTAKTAAADGREAGTDRVVVVVDEYNNKQSTPVKNPLATCTAAAAAGKSSKKATGAKFGSGGTASAAAVKSATRKLLPQLLLDHRHVDRSSPVSGTIIVPATSDGNWTAASKRSSPSSPSSSTAKTDWGSDAAATDGDQNYDENYDGGDIDPEFNVVVATEEARRRLESIPNALGPYLCRLCGVRYADAFALARHRCRCIVHVRYSCPECDKVFQCPANLASHRRWHGTGGSAVKASGSSGGVCGNNRVKSAEGQKPEAAAQEVVGTTNNVCSSNNNNINNDGGEKKETLTTAVTTAAAGFKKNILQRAVQAAAAANNNNNNDDDDAQDAS